MKYLSISGSVSEVGYQLGVFGQQAWHQKLTRTTLWQTVMTLQQTEQTRRMRAQVQAQFPLIWRELEGLARGLQAPLDEVFAWNCRGDLVRSTSDGCTTVAGRRQDGALIIAHNEDGFPQLRDDCALVRVKPEGAIGFTSFVYPGSLCGHTFAVNDRGVVNTVNNIRAVHRPSGLPRQILARAALNARSLDEAIAQLTRSPRAGAFHHTLGQSGDSRLFSVEATGSGCSVMPLSGRFGHANHLIHPPSMVTEQVITDSSASRQQRLEAWRHHAATLEADAAIAILSDQQDTLLPVYRLSPQDPDEENTLATALFILKPRQVEWQVFTQDRTGAILQGVTDI